MWRSRVETLGCVGSCQSIPSGRWAGDSWRAPVPRGAGTWGRRRESARRAPPRVECPNRAEHANIVLNEANAFLSHEGRVKINILNMFTYCSAGGYRSQGWLHRLNAKKPFSDDYSAAALTAASAVIIITSLRPCTTPRLLFSWFSCSA